MHVVAERSDRTERPEPFQLKGGAYTLVVLKVVDPADERFFPQLAARVRQAPLLFRSAPVVLDFADLAPGVTIDLTALLRALRDLELAPIAVQGAGPGLLEAASEAGLPALGLSRPARLEPEVESEKPSQPAEAGKKERTSLLVTEPVRSGRRIYSRGDLVVLAPVSQGAELLADGHIHIYASLRGRALAGLSGDRTARIFCQSLQAELVSIAGLYRVNEDLDKGLFRKSVQIYLEEDRLRVDPLV